MTEQLASLDSASCAVASALGEESGKTHEEESQLLEGLREGTESAYEALILRFEQPVYNLVSRLLKDPADACDVVQEVFLKVFRKIRAFRGQSSLKTWIYRIAVNEAHNHCRWYGRHRRQEVDLEGREEGGRSYRDSIPAGGGSPFDYVLESEKHTLIEQALSSLSPSFRAVVVLRDIEDMTYEEIAQVLQLPLGTVKSRILRGRDALRRELGKRLEPEPSFQMTPQTVE